MPDYATLRAANVARQEEWLLRRPLSLSFRSNEMAGEAGEVAEVILTKWYHYRTPKDAAVWREALADELADVIICADLIALCTRCNPPPANVWDKPGNEWKWCAGLLRDIGLVCNYIKKIERTTNGIAGGADLHVSGLEDKLLRVNKDIYDMAYSEGIDMEVALARKFNKTSAKVGLTTFFIPPGYDRARLIAE